mgnify:CR=1 FL=1
MLNWDSGSVKLALASAGVFFLSGLLTGVWKYAHMARTPAAQAPVYVDIAHRAALFYSFAALLIGLITLRTSGVYFIMITLAFAQMAYYIAIALDRYGGDDGMTIYKRSQFSEWINLSNKTFFYYLCFALLHATVYLVWRIVNSRFGMVIQGARSNERRMRAIGFCYPGRFDQRPRPQGPAWTVL